MAWWGPPRVALSVCDYSRRNQPAQGRTGLLLEDEKQAMI